MRTSPKLLTVESCITVCFQTENSDTFDSAGQVPRSKSLKALESHWTWWLTPLIPSLRRVSQRTEVKDSPGHRERSCLKPNQTKVPENKYAHHTPHERSPALQALWSHPSSPSLLVALKTQYSLSLWSTHQHPTPAGWGPPSCSLLLCGCSVSISLAFLSSCPHPAALGPVGAGMGVGSLVLCTISSPGISYSSATYTSRCGV